MLPSKFTNLYTAAFQHLIEKCIKNDMLFNPVRMSVDFEKAIHAPANTVWPSIQMKRCRFHLGQSWHRKIQNLGLSTNYKKNTKISNFLQLFFRLLFLNLQDIENCFTACIMTTQPQYFRLLEFTDYIFDS